MVRLSDLLKKIQKQTGSEKEQPKETNTHIKKEEPSYNPGSPQPKPSVDSEREASAGKEKSPGESAFAFSKMLLKEENSSFLEKENIADTLMTGSMPSEKETRQLYANAVRTIRKVYHGYKENGAIDWNKTKDIANTIVNNIISGTPVLAELFHEIDSLILARYHNAVNVCVLSVRMGVLLRYNKSVLLDLALCGLLHDIGLIKISEVINKPGKLNEKEWEEVKNHPLNVASLVDKVSNIKDEVLKIILLEHHERRKGSGYPNGLTEKDIHKLVFLIGIADSYEAMTHSRYYKEKLTSHNAILKLIETGEEIFPKEAIKLLIMSVGLYPAGSLVELNTGEICKVSAANINSPLRPEVIVLTDNKKKSLEASRAIDLRNLPSLHIIRCMECRDLDTDKF